MLKRFRAKWIPVRVNKTLQNACGSDFSEPTLHLRNYPHDLHGLACMVWPAPMAPAAG
jgi:hypothetical protein